LRRQVQGQTTVEFALICLPFFALLFAIVDFAQIYFYENSLQNAMREACRFGTAGDIIQATVGGVPQYETNSTGFGVPKAINDSMGREASRDECMKYWFESNCIVHIPYTNITIFSAPYPTGVTPLVSTNSAGKLDLLSTNGVGFPASSNGPTDGPGQANDYLEIKATYNVNTITPLFGYLGGYSRQGFTSYPIIVTAIVRNEPALLNFQHLAVYASNSTGEY
jgi:hypothetical protein